ncbi:MAG: protein adenylyltransferase SelO family protein, partial [Pseudomonadota bacterium]
CLAQSLLGVLDGDKDARVTAAQGAVDAYPALFEEAWLGRMRAKLGIAGIEDSDRDLIEDLFKVMAEADADFTLTFRGLADGSARAQFGDPKAYDAWTKKWRAHLNGAEPDLSEVNPVYIPRNHLVAKAIAAGEGGDFDPFDALVDALEDPFHARDGLEEYAVPPRAEQIVHRTFCGT